MKNILDFPEAEPLSEEESLAALIGPEKDYYLEQWARMQEERGLSFHPWAFCFGIFWLLYRRLFSEAALFAAFFLGLGLLRWSDLGFWLYENIFFGARLLALHLILGFAGNRIYLLHCKRRLDKVQATVEAREQAAILQRKGGVSLLAPILVFLLASIWFISNYYFGNFGINTNFIF